MLFPILYLFFLFLDVGHSSVWRCRGGRRGGEGRAAVEKPSTVKTVHPTRISHPFTITSMISFYIKKWYHFHSNEARSRAGSTLSFTYRWLCKFIHCSPMQREEERENKKRDWWWKRLLEGSRVVAAVERNSFGFSLESEPFVRAHSQMRFSTTIWPGYELLNGSSTCFPSPFLHRPYFVQMGLHRAGH